MSYKAGSVVIDIKADTAKLTAGMQRAEKAVTRSIDNIKKTLVTLVAAYAGIQSVRYFKNMIEDSLDAADATGKLAQKIGISTEKLSEYQYAAGFAAVSNGELTAGLGALTRRLNNFQISGGGAGKKGFEALGISAIYAKEHFTSLDVAFEDILKRLEEMPDGYKKTAVAQDIFSKSASGILKLTSSDLQKFSKEAQKIGISISQSTYEMAAAYHDQMDQLDARLKGIKQTVAFSVVAPMDAASKTVVDMYDSMFTSPVEKMQYFEDVAVTSIANIVHSFGFIKDAVNGIELVLQTAKLGFLYLVKGIVEAFNVANNLGNDAIRLYNSLPAYMRGEEIDLIQLRDTTELNASINETTQNILDLAESLQDGRLSSDQFVKKFKSNLAQVKESSKDATLRKSPTVQKDTSDSYDPLAKLDAKGFEISQEFDKKSKKDALYEIEKTHDSMTSILDMQIELTSSSKDWASSLKGVAGNINTVSNAITKQYVLDMKYKKNQISIDKKHAKAVVEAGGDEQKIKEANLARDKDTATLKETYKNAELSGYAELAGAMASAYQQGSDEAIAFSAVQSALGIASSWTAIANAWALPFPSNIPAVAMVASAVMPIISQLGGSSGGSGGSSSSISTAQQSENVQNSEESLIVDRLDRQIELLDKIARSGTAQTYTISKSESSYEKDMNKLAATIREDFQRNTGSTSALYTQTDTTYKTKYQELKDNLGFDIFSGVGYKKYEVRADGVQTEQDAIDFIAYFNENRDVFNSLMSNMEDDLNNWINSAQSYINEFALSTLDSLSVLKDSSNDLKDIYDSITNSSHYAYIDLQKANDDINKLLQDSGSSDLESYISAYIDDINKLDKFFSDDVYSTLLSTDVNDLSAQAELVKELSDLTGETFTSGAEDAINYLDSIKLVADAMATSNNNIKSFEDSFKSSHEIASDMAEALNVSLATSYSELDALFESLKGGIDGLTDAELDLLNANKELIASSTKALDDAWLGEYSTLSQLQKTQYANNIAYEAADTSPLNAQDAALRALETASMTATRDEDIAIEFNNYIRSLENSVSDATQRDVVNEIQVSNELLVDVVDRLERIEQNG